MDRARTLQRVALGTLVFIALALAGCGVTSTATGSIAADQITQVRIIHTASALSVGAPLLDKTIHNATTAQQLYNATVALPLFPSGVMNCAADTGETYTLDFTRANATPLDVVAHPSGCQRVTISGQAARRATSSFWTLLRQIAQAPQV